MNDAIKASGAVTEGSAASKEKLLYLLRKGAGTRSVSRFAKDCSLSREYVSRVLNGQVEKPSKKSLKKMADACENISYNDLLSCCGYEPVDPRETAEKVKEALGEGLKAFSGITQWASVQDFCDALRMSCAPVDGAFKVLSAHDTERGSGAKSSCLAYFRWEDGDYAGYTYIGIDYTDADGLVYVHDAYFPESLHFSDETEKFLREMGRKPPYEPDLACEIYRKRKGKEAPSAEERLLRAIFGEGKPGDKKVYHSFEGFGFYTNESLDPFCYIASNREYLCRNRETALRYKNMLKPDGSAEKAFKGFEAQGKYIRSGAFGAVAEILTNKTGVEFGTLVSDEGPYGHEECIMYEYLDETAPPHKLPQDVIYAVYEAAESLGAESFGNVAVTYAELQRGDYRFKTEDYYIPF